MLSAHEQGFRGSFRGNVRDLGGTASARNRYSIGTACCKRSVAIAETIGDMDRANRLDRMRHVRQTAEVEGDFECIVISPIERFMHTKAFRFQ